MTIETKYNLGDEKPALDHQLTATVDSEGFVTVSGKILAYHTPLPIDWFVETIDAHACDTTDLDHVFLEIIHNGRRSTIAHVYTDTDKLVLDRKPDGLYFTARVFLNLDWYINSLNQGDTWEVGYSFLTAPMGSVWSVDESTGLDQRLVMHIERIYTIIIRQPKDRKVSGDDKEIVQQSNEK